MISIAIVLVILLSFSQTSSLQTANDKKTVGNVRDLSREFSPAANLPASLLYSPAGLVNSSLPSPDFDEQLGLTFTQNFSSLSYNVTAVEQQDVYGYGPAYLLNGLTNVGYWYQVGLSWDWPVANGGYSSGFAFNYEVFAPNGSSIYPQNSGGLVNFTGPVDPGDAVGLSLNFTGPFVTMQAIDRETNSTASVAYYSFGADEFVGLPNAVSNSKGFFTGLMTEEYHVAIYNGSETKVTFSSASNISSAWMWVDELNSNTSSLVFFRSTFSPVSYVAYPGKLEYFFYEGATLISNAYEFITGTSGSVLLTINYAEHGGTPPVAPKFVYSSNGSIQSQLLGEEPTTFLVDSGSTWSVSGILPSLLSSGERWTTPNSTSGVAEEDETITIVYYHQFLEDFSFEISGGGSGFNSPGLTFENIGRPNSILLAGTPLGIWVDAGTDWNATNLLLGSNSLDRWVGNETEGAVLSAGNVSIVYFHEDFVEVGYTVIGGGSGYSPPELESLALNYPLEETLSNLSANLWLDNGAPWYVSSILNGSTSIQRWATPESSGVVSEYEIYPAYYHQNLVAFEYSVEGNDSGFNPPIVNWTYFGTIGRAALNSSRYVWCDYGTPYSYPGLAVIGAGERWVADSNPNGTILSQAVVAVKYQTQFYVTIEQPRYGGGAILSPASGWYNSSATIKLISHSTPGWSLGSWSGAGLGSYSGNSSGAATITVDSPLTETATFNPAFTISSGSGGTVSYYYDGRSGIIYGGHNVTISVPPLTEVGLTASATSSLGLFTSWHGAIGSASKSLLIQVRYPEKIDAVFGFNYPIILLSIVALVGAISVAVLSIYRRRRTGE